jgi:hypothetical protein
MENGILHPDTPPSKVDQIVSAALANAGNGPIVLYFHGGLVSYKAGMGTAERLLPDYQASNAYPVFFVWESGIIETITNNIGEIAKERIFQIIWKRIRAIIERKVTQMEGGKDIGYLPQLQDTSYEEIIDKAISNDDGTSLMSDELAGLDTISDLTESEASLLEAELQYDSELYTEVQNLSASLRDPEAISDELNSRSATVRGSTATLMDPGALDVVVDRPSPQSKGLISVGKVVKAVVKISAKTISRFVRRRDHGLHATIVEEILHELYLANVGGLIWKTMKKDTTDSFGPDATAHGGTAFLESLRKQSDPTAPPRIMLVGHSTGAVYISKFLENADEKLADSYRFDLVYLAPASTFQLTAKTVEDYGHRISGFRMFTMNDEKEKDDTLVPVLYPHSLLYFVSGVVEPDTDMPIIGMQRFFSKNQFPDQKFPAVAKVRDYLASVPDATAWSVTTGNPPGRNTEAVSHGAFSREPTTQSSVQHIVQSGY